MHPVFYRISSWLMLPRAFSASPQVGLTIMLHHRFIAPGESREAGIERLRRQLDWLSSRYTILSMTEALQRLGHGTLPPYCVAITVDDADLDLLEAYPVFEQFGVSPTLGVVIGWTDRETGMGPSLAQVVDHLHWYNGPERRIDLVASQSVVVDRWSPRDDAIDRILVTAEREGPGFVARVWDQLSLHSRGRGSSCSWSELCDLGRRGAEIASHTVSHCRLSRCSDERLRFELEDSKRVCQERIGSCSDFIYPFGTDDIFDARTTAAAARAGYRCALLTRAGLATAETSRFHLPRIEIPDRLVEAAEYRDRVLGGHIPFSVVGRAIDEAAGGLKMHLL